MEEPSVVGCTRRLLHAAGQADLLYLMPHSLVPVGHVPLEESLLSAHQAAEKKKNVMCHE